MKKINHPNCVHLFDVIVDDPRDEILIVLEYVDGGPSQKNDSSGAPIPLPERTIWSHLRHFVMGLEYLHMSGIVHRDIKPDNLLVTNGGGVLKIADFGTSCFSEEGKGGTVGTPSFFSPELCTQEAKGSYDERAVDLWAVGVTLYQWVCARSPFIAPTMMLLMREIASTPPTVPPPTEASAGLQAVITGLLTKDLNTRLTLNQLRHHDWLTTQGAVPLPDQPVALITEATPEEIALAFSNREAMKYQSAAGPGTFGRDIDQIPDWRREGPNTIRRRTNQAEADNWRAIAASGHLSLHIPVVYSIDRVAQAGGGSTRSADAELSSVRLSGVEGAAATDGPAAADSAVSANVAAPADDMFDVRMQDLASNMTRPCAMRFVMGSRTVVAADLGAAPSAQATHPALCERMHEIDTAAASAFLTAEEAAARKVTRARYLAFLDALSSTSTLGFRIDAAKTVVDGEIDDMPPPGTHNSLATVRTAADVGAALSAFLQEDPDLAHGLLKKLHAITAALERSTLFAKTVFLRAALLLTYDDEHKADRLELKMINFSFCYQLPEGIPPSHDVVEWDGKESSHADGFLFGVRSLTTIVKMVHTTLSVRKPPAITRTKSRLSKYIDNENDDDDDGTSAQSPRRMAPAPMPAPPRPGMLKKS